ncbi:MAG: hypothetical protein Q7R56_03220 [Nanoarchaeota archaeon]|nr:hypothetical protein [Nanoarchaeota archaeon]
MQDRFLQFLAAVKVEETRALLPHLPLLMESSRHPDGTLKVSARTASFTNEWVLDHGHSSIKEETALFGHVENISDITGKKITGHPLNKPQVKSTRYISYGSVLDRAFEDEDLKALPNADQVFAYIDFMNKRYVAVTEQLTELVMKHEDTGKVIDHLRQPNIVEREVKKAIDKKKRYQAGFEPTAADYEAEKVKYLAGLEQKGVQRDIGKFVLDSSRVYLLAVTKTSLGQSVDARTLEEIIIDMISSPRLEDQRRGHSIWTEARKIAPILLGQRSHIRVDEWKVKNEQELRPYFQERFNATLPGRRGLIPSPVILYQQLSEDLDRYNAALALFPYLNAPLQDILGLLTPQDVRDVLEMTHKNRGERDVLNRSLGHTGLTFEITMGYHGYRDIFRHRNGARSTQLLTTQLGFEVPPLFIAYGLDEQYLQDMHKAAVMVEDVQSINPHVAEKLVPFGANCRSLHSWSPHQVGYVTSLRSDIHKGNFSYVRIARKVAAELQEIMPITGKKLRVKDDNYPIHLWNRGYEWYDQQQEQWE